MAWLRVRGQIVIMAEISGKELRDTNKNASSIFEEGTD